MDLLKTALLTLCIALLSACGGGGGGGGGGGSSDPSGDNSGTPADTTPPPLTSMSMQQLNAVNIESHSFTPGSAEVDTDYFYSYTDQNSEEVSGTGIVPSSRFTVSDIDLSSLADGPITFEFYLVDDAGNQSSSVIIMLDKEPGTPDSVVLSGIISFEYVPHNSFGSGLNYTSAYSKPARSIEVLLLDEDGLELDSTITNNNGEYSFSVEPETSVKVRAKARLLETASAGWDFSVVDNTNDNALYVLEGSLADTGVTNTTRNLYAASGWSGSEYTETRAAAPFAILDTVFRATLLVKSSDPTVNFPPAKIHWSVLNTSAVGDIADGDIGSTFYSNGDIFVLGAADNDTDEYDEHVIAHEWGHYFEEQLSRSDSFGGEHTDGDLLDMRVAFSEGFGNAFSAMVIGDSVYKDSSGDDQVFGFSFDIEDNNGVNKGWYSEASVHAILYDIYDANDDNGEFIATGMDPIYNVLTSSDYKNAEQVTSIHLFLALFKQQYNALSSDIDDLADDQDIVVVDAYGSGETNNGGLASTLPIYKTLTVGGPSVEICSTDDFGTFNKLSNAELIKFSISSNSSYTFNVNRSSGLINSDPDLRIWRSGQLITGSNSAIFDSETLITTLSFGNYILEVEEYGNIIGISNGDVCFDVEID